MNRWFKFKKLCKQVWWFIWEDDSWASWFVNVVLAFILIKFVVYPGLGLLLSTSHPIVAVVSSSMEHEGSFDDWWASSALCPGDRQCRQEQFYQKIGISRDEFRDFRFRNGFNKGDIMILYGTNPENVKTGDVIVFLADRPDPIIHRVIAANKLDGSYVFATKGDHNAGSFYFESYIPEDSYIGRAVLRVPFLGYIKIGFVKLLDLIGLV
jgi:signal peptidase I